MDILNMILERLIDIVFIFFILYLAGLLKKKFGKTISDYFVQAAGIAVTKTEQDSLTSKEKITSKEKKQLAKELAQRILSHNKIKLKTKTDEQLLEDIIESEVYKMNKGTRL